MSVYYLAQDLVLNLEKPLNIYDRGTGTTPAIVVQVYSGYTGPYVDSGQDLGASAKRWEDLYLSGKAIIRDADIYVNSDNDGYLDLHADTAIRLNGTVRVEGTLNAVFYEDEIISLDNDMVFA